MFELIESDINKPQQIENFTFDSQENNILLDLTNFNGSNKTPTRKRSINKVCDEEYFSLARKRLGIQFTTEKENSAHIDRNGNVYFILFLCKN